MTYSDVSRAISAIHRFLIKFEWIPASLFFAILLWHIWATRYVPSLDGPQHLYNAHVLTQLILGNDLFREFFRLNPVIVGYWSGHLILGFYKLFLPAWMAQKFLLMTYAAGMFFSFRYLVRSFPTGRDSLLVYLVFPFIFHFYMALGYYSFSLAVIFFFWALGYWIRKQDDFGWKELGVLAALAMGVFLSHALVFVFFWVTLMLYFFSKLVMQLFTKRKKHFPPLITKAWKLALSVLPAFLLWVIYLQAVRRVKFAVTPSGDDFRTLAVDLMKLRQLVGFNHEVEAPPLRVLGLLLVVLSVTALLLYAIRHSPNYSGTRKRELDQETHSWVVVVVFFLMAYFLMPDRISAGSLTDRYGLYFFFTLIILLAFQPVPRFIQLLSLLALIGITWGSRQTQHHFMESLTNDIRDIRTMSPEMEERSTVLNLNASDNWIHIHFGMHVATDKSLIHLNNPQCAGQFPIIWNDRRMPELYVGDKPFHPGGSPEITGTGPREQVDYITVYHQEKFWADTANHYWHQILDEYYQLVMTTPRELGALYRRTHSDN